MCNCKNVPIGSYDNQIQINNLPPHMLTYRAKCSGDPKSICLDACIAEEVQDLWELGVTTTGCCCGHNRLQGFIGVISEDIPKMKVMGYEVHFNPSRPDAEDSFIATSIPNIYPITDSIKLEKELTQIKSIAALEQENKRLKGLMGVHDGISIHPKIHRFAMEMQKQININTKLGKDTWETWYNFKEILVDLEYHKAKMIFALKEDNMIGFREYLADCGNILMFLGNACGLYGFFENTEPVTQMVSPIFEVVDIDKAIVRNNIADLDQARQQTDNVKETLKTKRDE